MKKQTLILILLAMFSTGIARAQTGFSCTWTITKKTPLSGTNYANSIPKNLEITQTGDSLHITRTSIGAHGEDVVIPEVVSTDGKPSVSLTPDKRWKSIVLQWTTDHTGFSETAVNSKPNSEQEPDYQRIETWALSPDGQTLTITRDFKSLVNPDDQWSVKGEFQKQ
jgi:hypothetical protein